MSERPSVTLGGGDPWHHGYPIDPDDRTVSVEGPITLTAMNAMLTAIQKELWPFKNTKEVVPAAIYEFLQRHSAHMADPEFQQYCKDMKMSFERGKFEHNQQSLRKHIAGIVNHLTPLLAAKKNPQLLDTILMYWSNMQGMTDQYLKDEYLAAFKLLPVTKAAMGQLHTAGLLDPTSDLAAEFGYGSTPV